MKFFLDNCLPLRWAPALSHLAGVSEYPVTHLRDKFPADAKDIDWIATLAGEGGWTIISGDIRITKLRHEREAWLRSGLTAFFLAKGWMNLPLWDQTWRIVRWWPDVIKQAGLVRPGAGFVIPLNYNGKFEQVLLK